ncbi:hypothetical protein [Clostridium estertheticum]|uniref:CGGC domain-containing protein n=1 Tax=Clostridium estertheticum TaxID=238834 RepID=A0A7Y3SWY8_9CLOT|nr:hypothetical protein [Clostridium estertheticum]MBW9171041.1 hypothetical protein [Clostridium estertheticum]NNU76518.1 hypothetical protein [Clostridium estertheticum]WBL46006.1 hypothetical protein LOR37_15105 [Clostridium estertheticum]WLC74095.1 hypothetical protein KTC99_15080 [Clostridium estertheticum]
MKIGIKYCGGCNPTYERIDVVLRIKKKIGTSQNIETIKQGIFYDIVIILCGCSRACASHNNIEAKYEKICITSGNDDSKLLKVIDKINDLSRGEWDI